LPIGLDEDADIQELYSALAANQCRNDLIFDDVVRALEEKRSPILLTERRDHLEHFANRLRNFTRNLVVLHGGMKPRERRNAIAQLASIPEKEERLLIATGKYIGEGFDDARLDTLFLALPVSWKGTLIQYTGRLHRLHSGKTDVRIYDYVDSALPVMAKMFEKRLKGYRAIGYAREAESPGHRKFKDEPVIEFDDEAIRSFEEDP
jgi:superfamily II DNA or RNA helicase